MTRMVKGCRWSSWIFMQVLWKRAFLWQASIELKHKPVESPSGILWSCKAGHNGCDTWTADFGRKTCSSRERALPPLVRFNFEWPLYPFKSFYAWRNVCRFLNIILNTSSHLARNSWCSKIEIAHFVTLYAKGLSLLSNTISSWCRNALKNIVSDCWHNICCIGTPICCKSWPNRFVIYESNSRWVKERGWKNNGVS